MKLKNRTKPGLFDKFCTRSIACSLLASASVCAFHANAYAQSTGETVLIRGTTNGTSTIPGTEATPSNSDIRSDDGNNNENSDQQTTGSLTQTELTRPRVEQPIKTNPVQQPVASNSSNLSDDQLLTARENLSVAPEQTATRSADDSTPFAPPGFRMGTGIANLTLQQSIGYSSNISQTPTAAAGYFSQTDIAFGLQSDWSRHQLSLNANAGYQEFLKGNEAARPTADIGANLRLDLPDGVTSTLGLTYDFATESLTSTSLGPNITTQPGVHNFGATAEVARNNRKLNLLLRGVINRTLHDDATTAGGVLDQSDRNLTSYGVVARAEYDNGASLKPFVQFGAGINRYDLAVDRNGDRRDSSIYEMRAGIALDFGEKLNGEIAAGYIFENYDEGNLADLTGYTLNGELNWSPSRETTVTLNAATRLNGSTTTGDNGSIIYSGGVAVSRQTSERLSLNLNATFNFDYDEQQNTTDATYTIGAGAQYWMNRYMAISANLGYQIFEGSSGTNDYNETTATLGVILQR